MPFAPGGVIAWAMSVLSADATLLALLPAGAQGIAFGALPPGTALPGIALNTITGTDLLAIANRWATDVRLQVSVFGPPDDVTGLTQAMAAAARVDALLNKQPGGAQGTVVIQTVRQAAHVMPADLVNGIEWFSAIQEYQVIAQ